MEYIKLIDGDVYEIKKDDKVIFFKNNSSYLYFYCENMKDYYDIFYTIYVNDYLLDKRSLFMLMLLEKMLGHSNVYLSDFNIVKVYNSVSFEQPNATFYLEFYNNKECIKKAQLNEFKFLTNNFIVV